MAIAPPEANRREVTPRQFYVILLVLMAVEVMSTLESVMVVTAMPAIMREFNGLGGVSWLVTAFLLVQAATAAIGGRLGDLYGRRRTLMLVLGICVAGSLLSATAKSLDLIIVGRAMQGLSGAILPLCYGILRQFADPRRLPFWVGILTAAWAVSSALGYVLAGHFVDAGHWRMIFWVTVVYGALLIALLLVTIPEPGVPREKQPLDILGGVLFVLATASIMYGLTTGASAGWLSLRAMVPLTVGLVALVYWIAHECGVAHPLIEIRLLADRGTALACLCWIFTGLGAVQLPLVVMMFLQQPTASGAGLGLSATLAGFLKLPSTAISLVAAPLNGLIAGKYGNRAAVLVASLTAAAAWIFMIFYHEGVSIVIVGSVIAASGSVMLATALPNLNFEFAPSERSSEVLGLATVIRGVAAAIGAQIIMTTLALFPSDIATGKAPLPSEFAYQLVFAFIAAASFCIAVIAAFLKPRASAVA